MASLINTSGTLEHLIIVIVCWPVSFLAHCNLQDGVPNMESSAIIIIIDIGFTNKMIAVMMTMITMMMTMINIVD